MIRIFLLLTLIILSKATLFGQLIYFNKAYDISLLSNNATSALQLPDSGYVFITCTYGSTYGSYCFVKTDKYGDTLFTKCYASAGVPFAVGYAHSLIHTNDTCIVFCGSTTDSGNVNRDAFLVKFNLSGDTLWTKRYVNNGTDFGRTVFQTNDSGFFIFGTTTDLSNNSNFYLIKTNSIGSFQWQQNYGTNATEDGFWGQPALDGGYLLSGQRGGDMYLRKTDGLGIQLWDVSFTGTSGFGCITELSDSTILFTGTKNIVNWGEQGYLMKLNKNGGLIWDKNHGWQNSDENIFSQPVVLSDGKIVFTGISTQAGIPKGWSAMTDSSGNIIWGRTYLVSLNLDNYLYEIQPTLDNGFIMSGLAFMNTTDAWLVKTDSLGCEVAGCDGLSTPEINNFTNTLQLFPNPNNGESLEVIMQFEGTNGTLAIYDLTGRCVHSSGIDQNKKTFSLGLRSWSDGVYMVRVVYPDGEIQTQKLIVQHH